MTAFKVLEEMLKPYILECRYLLEAELDFPKIRGRFSIPKPFYCVNTGHFNATELMICYNQLCYTFFAESLDCGLIETAGRISIEEFKKYQAENCFITRMDNIRFRRPINPQKFSGELTLEKFKTKNGLMFCTTGFSFKDDNEGKVTGNALLALVKNLDK